MANNWRLPRRPCRGAVKYLLDTDTLSEPARRSPDKSVLRRMTEARPEIVTSTVVVHEMVFGILRLQKGLKRDMLTEYCREFVLDSVPALAFDLEAALWLAGQRATLAAVGRPVPFVDGMIAGTAAVHDLTLVTHNVRHFEGFSGLRVESWHMPT